MKSLKNRTIISTRPISREDNIKDYLSDKGANVIDFPMIEISSAIINDNIKNALINIKSFQWIVFTSKNGVDFFFRTLKKLKISAYNVNSIKIAAIGEKTAQEVKSNGMTSYFISSGNTSEEMVKELANKQIKKGDKVLLVLGELAKSTLETGLSKIADLTRIDIYKTLDTRNHSKDIIERIKKDNYDMIIFTSPSGVNNFLKLINKDSLKIACIGQTTEKEILRYNQKPLLVSTKPDGLNFAQDIEKYFDNL